MSKHPYDMVEPCPDCPFRDDIPAYLHPERYEELSNEEGEFPCHKTTTWDDDKGVHIDCDKEKVCAGFLILNENSDTPNQMMRIAERLGIYDRRKLRMKSPVYEHWDAAIAASEERSHDHQN